MLYVPNVMLMFTFMRSYPWSKYNDYSYEHIG